MKVRALARAAGPTGPLCGFVLDLSLIRSSDAVKLRNDPHNRRLIRRSSWCGGAGYACAVSNHGGTVRVSLHPSRRAALRQAQDRAPQDEG
jgi:hypothetical protein